MSFLRKLMWLATRDRREAELREELQFHLDEEMEDRAADGLPIDEARRAARLDLGNLGIVREDTRAAWGWTLLEQLGQDLRYGVRVLVANKAFSALAILSLALGIGANTAIFSFMDAMLLRSLPVKDPESLVTLAWQTKKREMHGTNRHFVNYSDPNGGFVGGIFSSPAFEFLQQDTSVFTTVFGYQGAGDLHLGVRGQGEIVKAEYVSGNFFSGLGVLPASGRLIAPDDDRFGAPAVAVISHALSEARFGGPGNAAGQSVLLDNVPFTVVGVAPPEFFGADPNVLPAVYLPMHTNVLLDAWDKSERDPARRYSDPGYDWVVPMARLRPGVTAARAQAALAPAWLAWKASTEPTREKDDLPKLVVRETAGGLDSLRRMYSKPLFLFLGLVGLILAIACANIANLLLARASARRREMAVRLSIGAGRLRVIRQLITESVLLSGLGGALGIAFAVWGIQFLMLLLISGRGDQPFPLTVDLNWRVLGVVAALSVLTGIVFGLAPAIQSTRVDLTPALKVVRAAEPRARTRRVSLSQALVVSQIAFTLLILVAAGLFLQTLSNLQSIPVGFNSEQLLTFQLNARQAGHGDDDITTFYDRIRAQVAGIPGVSSVAISGGTLLGGGMSGTLVTVPGGISKSSHVLSIGPGFFTTVQIPVLRGRPIEANDRPGAPIVAVINQQFARIFFGREDPVGRRVTMKRSSVANSEIQIVGVVADALYGELRANWTGSTPATPPPTLFLSYSQAAWGPVSEVTYQVRTSGDPLAPMAAIRDVVSRADSRVPVTRMKTQRALIDAENNQEVTFARLCTVFALLALTIACVGLYGTMSYGVARRTSEIGIRMALGAARATVVGMVLREVITLTAVGVAISVPVALAASKLLESFLFGMTHYDPLPMAAAMVTLLGATLVAGYVPAYNASRINPTAALRHE